ncbi:MAG: TIGR03936 family radical SAM-associated protein [Gemmataceae bacterium]
MAPEPRATETTTRFKYRLRFAKEGDLRLVSHHDLMHCCERLFRRGAIPIAFSQGFHPTPRMVFAQSLALGIVGSREVLELELTEHLAPEDLLAALRQHAPPGLVFHSARQIPANVKAQPRRAFYRVTLTSPVPDLPARCEELLKQDHAWVERLKPYARRVDIRPFLERVAVTGHRLEFTVWVTPNGSAKADEILRLLDVDSVLDDGGVLERCDLELADEVGPDAPSVPVIDSHSVTLPLDEKTAVPVPDDARPTSLIEGPLNFDS